MSNPIFTISIDYLPNGKVSVWTQKKEKLTREQEDLFREFLRKAHEIAERTRQLDLIADG